MDYEGLEAYVRIMDNMPPPAPAKACATLSFWGMVTLGAAAEAMVMPVDEIEDDDEVVTGTGWMLRRAQTRVASM